MGHQFFAAFSLQYSVLSTFLYEALNPVLQAMSWATVASSAATWVAGCGGSSVRTEERREGKATGCAREAKLAASSQLCITTP
jgi:hypothetical protein